MATLKDVQIKIGAVKKTKQITKAMNMVAASRLKGSQRDMDSFKPYANKFAEVLGSLAEKSEQRNLLLAPKEEVKKINIILCTSDRGLCGGFNMNLINEAGKLIKRLGNDKEISFTAFGKKVLGWCKAYDKKTDYEYIGVIGANFNFSVAANAGQKLIDDFIGSKYDEVYIVYPEFINVAKQKPIIRQVLPIPPLKKNEEVKDKSENKPFLAEHICEPSANELLDVMLPKSIFVQIHSALLETSACEHAARMTAMNNATIACNDMIQTLTLAYNKARQSAITAELMDIVGGAEALKG